VPLRSWYAEARRAAWEAPADIKLAHRKASFVAGDRVVFNIKGNDYRLIAAMRYRQQILYIRFVGTHRDYDKIDAATV
jgi:mRNA interferase HigB